MTIIKGDASQNIEFILINYKIKNSLFTSNQDVLDKEQIRINALTSNITKIAHLTSNSDVTHWTPFTNDIVSKFWFDCCFLIILNLHMLIK